MRGQARGQDARRRALAQVHAHRQAVRRVMPPPVKIFRDRKREPRRGRISNDE